MLGTLHPGDLAAVVSFDSHLKLWLDFTSDPAAIHAAIDQAMLFGDEPEHPLGDSPFSLARTFDFAEALDVASPERALEVTARSTIRPTTNLEDHPGNDERFVYNVGAIQSIAASNSQNDNGIFELNFKEERYLPFEGCGAVSSWRLELPMQVRQFNYSTISDVILHVKYTAREGGSSLRGLAEASLKDRLNAIKQQLSQTGLYLALNLVGDHDPHLLGLLERR